MSESVTSRALRMYNERRRRARFMPKYLLTDHAWDILLWVFIENQRGRRITPAQVCEAVDVSEQAGRRWFILLRDAGLLAPLRTEDGTDDHLALSDDGFRRLERYISTEIWHISRDLDEPDHPG